MRDKRRFDPSKCPEEWRGKLWIHFADYMGHNPTEFWTKNCPELWEECGGMIPDELVWEFVKAATEEDP